MSASKLIMRESFNHIQTYGIMIGHHAASLGVSSSDSCQVIHFVSPVLNLHYL